MNIALLLNNKEFKLKLQQQKDDIFRISVNKETYDVSLCFLSPEEFIIKLNGRVYDVMVHSNSRDYQVCINGKFISIGKRNALRLLGKAGSELRRQEIKASMPGRVIDVLAGEGEKVKKNQAIVILEAMKMQNEIKSPQDGTIARIGPKTGDPVKAGALLFTVE
ncbi:MAG: biotin/lipoyl-containing protein [Candidatus Aminicenantaceae bacterium]